MFSTKYLLHKFLWPLLLLGVILIYLPGINGIFLLDDTPNLRPLAEIVPPLTWQKIYNYVVMAGEIASPTLRPVSMLSFALQYSAWPAHPQYFKMVNISIHLVNGFLIYLVACRIATILGVKSTQANLMACWSATFWLLHPINISSVLYIVQRMALLAATFGFASVWLYLLGRERVRNGLRHGWVLVTAAVVLTGGLSFFSKENGALLPLLLLVVESTIFSSSPIAGRPWIFWKINFLWAPALFVVGYLVFKGFSANEVERDFTVIERFLTQFRVLSDYFGKIIFPRPKEFGLYFDDYKKSLGLFQPFTTFVGAVGVSGFLLCAIWRRKENPLFAFAVLWFFAAHAIESTTLMLELYFEHRNYLPLMGVAIALPFVPIVLPVGQSIKRLVILGGCAALLGIAILTFFEVRLWGDPVRQAIVWGQEKPASLRARSVMAGVYALTGDTRRAYQEYMLSSEYFSWTAGPLTDAVLLRCADSSLPLVDIDLLKNRLLRSNFSFAPVNNFSQVVELLERHKCAGVSHDYMVAAINALLKNPRFVKNKIRSHLYLILARLYAIQRQLSPTIAYSEMANEQMQSVDILIQQAEWYISANLYGDAMAKLDQAEILASKSYLKKNIYAEVVARDKIYLNALIVESSKMNPYEK